LLAATCLFAAQNAWTHKEAGNWKGSYSATVEPHGVVMLRLNP
jgi:hypothetical protein